MYLGMCLWFIYVFVWFFVEREGVGHIKTKWEFLSVEYGVFILPPNETTMAFSKSTVLYCTNVAHGYNNIGMSYSAKCNVQKKVTTRTEEILSLLKDRKYYSIFYYGSISKKITVFYLGHSILNLSIGPNVPRSLTTIRLSQCSKFL